MNLKKNSQQPPLMNTPPTADNVTHSTAHRRQVIRRHVASWARWLHIYLSMVSFAILLFFAVTGLTLNHSKWFSAQRSLQRKGSVESKWLNTNDASVDKLAIAEHLRQAHGVKGSLSNFELDEAKASVLFTAPGYTAYAFINRETGEYELTETRFGLVATLNDLHVGRHTGRVWSWLIDTSAVVMSLVSLTGLILIWFVKRRRASGLILAGVGAVVCYLIYLFLIP
jgi:hypothetical protein